MKKKILIPLTNKHGYALLLTLVAITIFTLLGFTLMTFAFTTTKQTNKIEEKVLATDMAELGVEYYNHVIDEEIENWINNADLNGSTEAIKNDAIDHLKSIELKEKKVDEENNLSFQGSEINFDDVDEKLEFTVTGKVGNSEALIDSYISLKLNNIKINSTENKEWIDRIAPDNEFTECKLNKGNNIKISGEKCKISGDITFQNNVDIKDSTIKVNGNLIFEKNMTSELEGDTVIYIKGNLGKEDNQLKINNVKKGHATLYVLETAYIDMAQADKDILKICTNTLGTYNKGKAAVYAITNNSGKVITNSKNGSTTETDLNIFKEECWDPGEPSIKWENPISRREYNYE